MNERSYLGNPPPPGPPSDPPASEPRVPPERRRRRRGRSGRGPLPTLALVVLGFLVAGLAGAGAYYLPVLRTAAAASASGSGIPLGNPVAPPATPFTVLLLGSDDDAKFPADRVLTQSMILLRVDPAARTATMLSIPRDLWVTIPGQRAKNKIDVAYELGGPDLAIKTVEQNFGVRVDDWVWVGLKGLIHVIDTMGGVDIMVTNPVLDNFYPADINTDNPYGYHRVAVLPGAVHMDGNQALQYVRSRHGDLRGDFARSERQQQVLLALRAQARNVAIGDLPDLVGALNGEVRTSIPLDRMRALLSVANQFGTGSIRQVVLLPPYTSSAYVGDADVILPDWNAIRPLIKQSFP